MARNQAAPRSDRQGGLHVPQLVDRSAPASEVLNDLPGPVGVVWRQMLPYRHLEDQQRTAHLHERLRCWETSPAMPPSLLILLV